MNLDEESDEEMDDGWVMTAIHPTDVEMALGPVVDVVKEQGLELDYIQLMSGDQVPSERQVGAYSCAEIHAYGRGEGEELLRSEYKRIAEDYDFDVAVQRDSDRKIERRLFCFDMDSTLIAGETIDELAKMAGVGDRVSAITAAAMRGEIDFSESFRRRVGLLKGLPEMRVREVVERIPMMAGAERLFRTLKARGMRTAIFSGGFTFFGEVLRGRLGVDHVYANELELRAGQVTGEVVGRIVDGARKAELLREVAELEGIGLEQVVAVGDGANDLPMLALAGMGVAFHGKPAVRAAAKFSVRNVGLDGLLYMLGIPDWDWV